MKQRQARKFGKSFLKRILYFMGFLIFWLFPNYFNFLGMLYAPIFTFSFILSLFFIGGSVLMFFAIDVDDCKTLWQKTKVVFGPK